jgi:hypothetical protein
MLHELCLPIIIHPVVVLLHCHLSNDFVTDLLPDVQQPLLIPPGPARILLCSSSEFLADDPEHLLALKDVAVELAQLALEFVQATRDDRLALVGRAGHKVGVSQEDQELVRMLHFAWEEAHITDWHLG